VYIAMHIDFENSCVWRFKIMYVNGSNVHLHVNCQTSISQFGFYLYSFEKKFTPHTSFSLGVIYNSWPKYRTVLTYVLQFVAIFWSYTMPSNRFVEWCVQVFEWLWRHSLIQLRYLGLSVKMSMCKQCNTTLWSFQVTQHCCWTSLSLLGGIIRQKGVDYMKVKKIHTTYGIRTKNNIDLHLKMAVLYLKSQHPYLHWYLRDTPT
jgi:hypothetical protein